MSDPPRATRWLPHCYLELPYNAKTPDDAGASEWAILVQATR